MKQTDASHPVPVFAPYLGPDTLRAVEEAFDVGWIGMGATTLKFERALAAYLKCDRHVVATMTGSAALHLGLLLADVGPGDEVILPSFNYIADIQAILWCGATPVFCDIEPQTLSLDPECVSALLTKRTKALMPLHFAGRVGDLAAIYDIARRNRLRVIEDATHALGSTCGGELVGAVGDICCFSFDPVKLITCLDGGAVVCQRSEDISRLHSLRLLGVDKDTTERYKNSRAWDYDVASIGYRAHMTNINAAIGLSQLERIDEFVTNRRNYCRAYDAAFRSCNWIDVPRVDWDAVGPFIYTIQLPAGNRDAFLAHLKHHGVSAGIHFLPCHHMSLCRNFPRGPLQVTEQVSREIVTLPLWSHMTPVIHKVVTDAVVCFQPEGSLTGVGDL